MNQQSTTDPMDLTEPDSISM